MLWGAYTANHPMKAELKDRGGKREEGKKRKRMAKKKENSNSQREKYIIFQNRIPSRDPSID